VTVGAEFLKVAVRREYLCAGLTDFGRPHSDQTLGVLIRQGSQKYGIHNAKNSRIGANRDSESEHSNVSEAGILAQSAESKPQVLPACFDK
jgi:hypothetical protein